MKNQGSCYASLCCRDASTRRVFTLACSWRAATAQWPCGALVVAFCPLVVATRAAFVSLGRLSQPSRAPRNLGCICPTHAVHAHTWGCIFTYNWREPPICFFFITVAVIPKFLCFEGL